MLSLIEIYKKHVVNYPFLEKPSYSLTYFYEVVTGIKSINVIRTVVLEWKNIGEFSIRWGPMDRLLAIEIITMELSQEIEEISGFTFCGVMYTSMSDDLEILIITKDVFCGTFFGSVEAVAYSSI